MGKIAENRETDSSPIHKVWRRIAVKRTISVRIGAVRVIFKTSENAFFQSHQRNASIYDGTFRAGERYITHGGKAQLRRKTDIRHPKSEQSIGRSRTVNIEPKSPMNLKSDFSQQRNLTDVFTDGMFYTVCFGPTQKRIKPAFFMIKKAAGMTMPVIPLRGNCFFSASAYAYALI